MVKATRKTRTKDTAASSAAELERVLGHHFVRPELLTLALTHRSFVFDGPRPEGADPGHPSQDNEQLEFLGDAVLGLLVAESLCKRFPASREGELTQLRAGLVSRRNLGLVGTRLDLGRWLRLGPTTDQAGGRKNAALVSNAVEAVIAALYLDGKPGKEAVGDLAAARTFVEREVMAGLTASPDGSTTLSNSTRDYKTALQELVQAEGLGRVVYEPLAESGPAHQRMFRFAVHLEGSGAQLGTLAEAEGSTKKQAQQEAAQTALRLLEQRTGATA
jgi:ribonuclease-3